MIVYHLACISSWRGWNAWRELQGPKTSRILESKYVLKYHPLGNWEADCNHSEFMKLYSLKRMNKRLGSGIASKPSELDDDRYNMDNYIVNYRWIFFSIIVPIIQYEQAFLHFLCKWVFKYVFLFQAYKNTVPVPRHWCFKRKYLAVII